MKTAFGVLLAVLCCFAVMAFGQRPENAVRFSGLLPINTQVMLDSEPGAYSIKILPNDYKPEDANKPFNDALNDRIAQTLDPGEKEMLNNMRRSPAAAPIYKTKSIGNDFFMFEHHSNPATWVAVPFSAVKSISQ